MKGSNSKRVEVGGGEAAPGRECVTVSREMEAVWGLVGAGDFEVIWGLFQGLYWGEKGAEVGLSIWWPSEQRKGVWRLLFPPLCRGLRLESCGAPGSIWGSAWGCSEA